MTAQRMSGDLGGRTEQLLRAAAAGASWPATPDARAAVVARIADEGLRPVEGRGPVLDRALAGPTSSRIRVGRALAIALLALLVLAGVATALGYRLPGLDLVFVDRLPPLPTAVPAGGGGGATAPGTTPTPSPTPVVLGSPVPLDEVLGRETPRVLVPAARPRPATAWVIGGGDRTIVTLAYPAGPGERTLGTSDLALTVMAVSGGTNDAMVTKMLTSDNEVEHVTVNGVPGWWITGPPHEIVIDRPGGDAGPLIAALAGDTLVFVRDGTVYRLESALGRDATIAIAGSMR
jgi:hypothetical protein